MDIGALRHRITLDNPSVPTPDTDGGASRSWPPFGGVRLGRRVPASVEPATFNQTLERPVAKTSEGVGTYTVRLRYLAGVSTQTRVTFHDGATDRTLWVNGITDDENRHAMLALTCLETVP